MRSSQEIMDDLHKRIIERNGEELEVIAEILLDIRSLIIGVNHSGAKIHDLVTR